MFLPYFFYSSNDISKLGKAGRASRGNQFDERRATWVLLSHLFLVIVEWAEWCLNGLYDDLHLSTGKRGFFVLITAGATPSTRNEHPSIATNFKNPTFYPGRMGVNSDTLGSAERLA